MSWLPPNGAAMIARLPPRLAITAIVAMQAGTLMYLDRIDARLARIEQAARAPASAPAPRATHTAHPTNETRPWPRSSAPS